MVNVNQSTYQFATGMPHLVILGLIWYSPDVAKRQIDIITVWIFSLLQTQTHPIVYRENRIQRSHLANVGKSSAAYTNIRHITAAIAIFPSSANTVTTQLISISPSAKKSPTNMMNVSKYHCLLLIPTFVPPSTWYFFIYYMHTTLLHITSISNQNKMNVWSTSNTNICSNRHCLKLKVNSTPSQNVKVNVDEIE